MKIVRYLIISLIIIFILGTSQVFAISQTIDQNYLPGPNLETPLTNQDYKTGQSFKPSLNRLTRIDVSLNKIAGADSQVNLILTTSSNAYIAETHTTCSIGINAFTFSSPVEVNPDNQYRFFLRDPATNYAWRGINPGTYSRGSSIINGNPSAAQDFLFRTWGYDLIQSSPSDPSVLEPPTDLEAGDVPNDEGKAVKLNWSGTVTTSYTGYNIYRAEKIEGDTSGIRSWLLVGAANFGDEEFTDEEDLDPTKTYYYIVRTYKGAYESEDSGEVEISPEDNIAPNAPKSLRITGSGKGWIELSWEAVSAEDLDGYEVQFGKDSANLDQAHQVSKDETTTRIDRLSRGTELFFVVKAKDTSGNLSPASNRVSQYIEGLNWVWYLLIGIVLAAGIGLYLYFAFKKRWWPFKKGKGGKVKNSLDKINQNSIMKSRNQKGNIMAEEKKIGTVSHYFGKIGVGIIKLSDVLKVGDKIKIKGATSDFEQEVGSMQVNHEDIKEAKSGDEVGVKLDDKVREGDEVSLVSE